MPGVRLSMTSTLSPSELMAVLTDFGPSRPSRWLTIDAAHFHLHAIGDTWAEVTEGTRVDVELTRNSQGLKRRKATITPWFNPDGRLTGVNVNGRELRW